MDLATIEALDPAGPDALASWRPGDAWLAGGTSLFAEPQPALRRLLDLHAFAWPALTISSDGLEIAATCPIAQLAAFTGPAHWNAVALFRPCAEALYMSWKVRSEATVGGNICLGLPAGAMISLACGLGASATIWTPSGEVRVTPVAQLVTGPGEVALAPGELLRSITLPTAALSAEVAMARASLSDHGRSAALVIGRREESGATWITLTASVTRPCVLAFPAPPTPEALLRALEAAAPVWFDDVHGDPDWREHRSSQLAEQVRAELAPVS